jgi:hypothetical protein
MCSRKNTSAQEDAAASVAEGSVAVSEALLLLLEEGTRMLF